MAPPAHSASWEFARSARELLVGYGEVNTEVQHPQRTRFPPLPGEVVDWKRGDQIISLGVFHRRLRARFVARRREWLDPKLPSGGEDTRPLIKLPSGGAVLRNAKEIGLPTEGRWSPLMP